MTDRNPESLRYQTEAQTGWQRDSRARKKQRGECQENGCHNEANGYRCEPCKRAHTIRELARQHRKK